MRGGAGPSRAWWGAGAALAGIVALAVFGPDGMWGGGSTTPAATLSTPAAAPPVVAPTKKPAGSSTPPVTDAPTVLTSGQQSEFGRLGVPGLLVFAVICALVGSLMRWFDPISKAVVAAGPKARTATQRGRRRR